MQKRTIKFALNASNCYENHMSYIAAEMSDPREWKNGKPTALSGHFGVRASFDTPNHEIIADNANTATETLRDTTTTETDHLVLNPYEQTLKQQILQIIDGANPGEAFEFIQNALQGENLDTIYNVLTSLSQEFESRGMDYLPALINEELSLIAAEYGNVTPMAHMHMQSVLENNSLSFLSLGLSQIIEDYSASNDPGEQIAQIFATDDPEILATSVDDIPSVANSLNAQIDDTGFYSRISPMMTAIREELEQKQKPKPKMILAPPAPTYMQPPGMAA